MLYLVVQLFTPRRAILQLFLTYQGIMMKYNSAVRHIVSAETQNYSSAIVLLLFALRLHRVLTPGISGMHPGALADEGCVAHG